MNESDREMLNLAAKAAGLRFEWRPNPSIRESGLEWLEWNPLADDGDAFRLMIKLDLSSLVVFSWPNLNRRREFWSLNSGYDGGKSATTESEYTSDPYAATRRAIVMAAAEIGKSML